MDGLTITIGSVSSCSATKASPRAFVKAYVLGISPRILKKGTKYAEVFH